MFVQTELQCSNYKIFTNRIKFHKLCFDLKDALISVGSYRTKPGLEADVYFYIQATT